jgi:hypothetical protein
MDLQTANCKLRIFRVRGATVKATSFVAAIVLTVGTVAHTQELSPPQNPPPAAPPAAAPAPAPASPSGARQAPDPRRRDIAMMEGVLTKALQQGAQDLAQQLKLREPNSAFVTGTGRARGIILDGYGVFFHVDVPGMRQSVIWSAQMLVLEQQRQSAEQFLRTSSPDHPLRKFAVMELRQIERLMAQGGVGVPSATTNAEMAKPGTVGAAVAVGEGAAVPPVTSSFTDSPLTSQMQPVQQLVDPNELYTDSVKTALIEAMLRYSAFLKIADNEWLTVAASDSDGPSPGQLDDASRIVIRIKGADLAAFQSNKLTKDEVMKRVEVKEF